jgi:hypothetical protein
MTKPAWKSNSVLTNNTVFLLRIKYSLEEIKYPSQLHSGTLGIFTNLQYAEHFLLLKNKSLYNFLSEIPWKIYEIEEIALNYFWNFVRTRFYDKNGKFYGEHVWEEENSAKNSYDHRFKKGDIIEFLEGPILHAAIVASVPPCKDTSPFKDYYIVLHGVKEYSCFRAASFNVFSLSGKITDNYKERLRERLKNENLRKLKKVIERNSDNTTYRIIE